MYEPFDEQSLKKIINLEVKPLKEKLRAKGISLFIGKSVTDKIVTEIKDSKFGARPISRIIQKQIEDPLATLLISKSIKKGNKISFTLKQGEISYNIKEEQA